MDTCSGQSPGQVSGSVVLVVHHSNVVWRSVSTDQTATGMFLKDKCDKGRRLDDQTWRDSELTEIEIFF